MCLLNEPGHSLSCSNIFFSSAIVIVVVWISVSIVFAYVYNYTPWDPFKTPEDIPRLPSICKVKQSVHLNPFDGNDIGAHLCVVPIWAKRVAVHADARADTIWHANALAKFGHKCWRHDSVSLSQVCNTICLYVRWQRNAHRPTRHACLQLAGQLRLIKCSSLLSRPSMALTGAQVICVFVGIHTHTFIHVHTRIHTY